MLSSPRRVNSNLNDSYVYKYFPESKKKEKKIIRRNRKRKIEKKRKYGREEIIRDLSSDPRSRSAALRSHDRCGGRTQRGNSFLPMAFIRFVVSSVSPLHSNLKDQETWKRSRCYSLKRPSTDICRHGFNHVRIHYNKLRIAVLNLLIYSSHTLSYFYCQTVIKDILFFISNVLFVSRLKISYKNLIFKNHDPVECFVFVILFLIVIIVTLLSFKFLVTLLVLLVDDWFFSYFYWLWKS